MKMKVCGMRNPENINELLTLPIDFMGLIFYPKSARYVESLELVEFKESISRVGVFVNSEISFIKQKSEYYNLNYLQLHGNETVVDCIKIKKQLNLPIIKAFSISEEADFEKTKDYEGVCDYFLFDTKTPLYGGSGQKFDWKVLDNYKGETLFFLSGGISTEDVEQIKKLKNPKLYALDLNSRFEIEPGLKNIKQIKIFLDDIDS